VASKTGEEAWVVSTTLYSRGVVECGTTKPFAEVNSNPVAPSSSTLLYANKLKDLSEESKAAVMAASGRLGGQLSLGASQTIGQYLLPALVAGFLRENPRVMSPEKKMFFDMR
jgi:hypothetical protein